MVSNKAANSSNLFLIVKIAGITDIKEIGPSYFPYSIIIQSKGKKKAITFCWCEKRGDAPSIFDGNLSRCNQSKFGYEPRTIFLTNTFEEFIILTHKFRKFSKIKKSIILWEFTKEVKKMSFKLDKWRGCLLNYI